MGSTPLHEPIHTYPQLGIELTPLTADDAAIVGGIRLHGRLGEGGMGRVYLGTTRGERAVAVKMVKDPYASDPQFRARFAQEVAIAARVSGAYTAPVLNHDTTAERPWLATAFVRGPTMSVAVARHGVFPTAGVWRLTAGIAEALQAIHAAGITHRDLKPGNVLLAADGPRVIDFGISRAEGDHSGQTQTGIRMGTPSYMAPEYLRGERPGPMADIFALGSVIAYAASGTVPFRAESDAELIYRITQGEPDLSAITHEGLRALITSCLAKDPAARPSTGEVLRICVAELHHRPMTTVSDWLPSGLAEALTKAEPQTPQPRAAKNRRRRVVIPIILVLITGGTATFSYWPQPPAVNHSAPKVVTSPSPSASAKPSPSALPAAAPSPPAPGISPGMPHSENGNGTPAPSRGPTPTPPVKTTSAAPSLPTGPYNSANAVIISTLDNSVLTAGGTGDGSPVRTAAWRGASAQRWKFSPTYAWPGHYLVTSKAAAVNVETDGGGQIYLSSTTNTGWYYDSATQRIMAAYGAFCLAAHGSGSRVSLQPCADKPQQRWKLVS